MPDEQTGQEPNPTGQEPTGTAGSESTATTQTTPSSAGAETQQFTAEYVSQLRREAAENRTKLRALEAAEKKRQEAEMTESQKLQARVTELEANLTAREAQLRETTLRTAVTAAAIEAGASNPSVLVRLIDPSAVEYAEDGSPKNLKKLVEGLKAQVPALFKPTTPGGSADAGASGKAGGAPSMNDLIRQRAGRS